MKVKNDPRSDFSNLSKLERRSLKKIRASTGFEPVTLRDTGHIFLTGRYELNKLTSLPMCGFIAQLVEHRTGIAEVTGSRGHQTQFGLGSCCHADLQIRRTSHVFSAR